MFHFKRRTLWIIIYITIPLILVLNSLGPEPESGAPVVTATENTDQRWSLTGLEPDCDVHCVLELDDTDWVRLSAVLDQRPVGFEEVPQGVALGYSQRAGKVIVTLSFPREASIEATVVQFLSNWLPRGDAPQWVLSGAGADDLLAQLPKVSNEAIGVGKRPDLGAPSALTVLISPPLGSEHQLAFLLWVEILKQRLAGYQIQVTWDHRRTDSVVLFNTTLSKDLLYPVTGSEFTPILEAYVSTAAQTERSAEQIHRYLLTSALYDIPFEFFTRQEERLEQVSLADINLIREQTIAQITQTK